MCYKRIIKYECCFCKDDIPELAECRGIRCEVAEILGDGSFCRDISIKYLFRQNICFEATISFQSELDIGRADWRSFRNFRYPMVRRTNIEIVTRA